MAWFDLLNQAATKGRDVESVSRQRLNARAAFQPPAAPTGPGLMTSLTAGSLLGQYVAAPAALAVGNYLRSPQGTLLKDRLGQGDIMGAFNAVTGLGGSTAPRLTQYNPPGFNPAAPVTSADLLRSAQAVSGARPPAPLTESANTLASAGSIAERAYQDEKRRALQLSQQDELAKKYRVADLTKAYNAASGDEKERLGLEIWATTNPQLAQKLKPGQLGYTEATAAAMSQSPFGAAINSIGNTEFANKLTSAPGVDVVSAFGLQTPLSSVPLPQGLKQAGVSESFAAATPLSTEMTQAAFTSDPMKLFKPDLSETQRKLLIEAFNKGLR